MIPPVRDNLAKASTRRICARSAAMSRSTVLVARSSVSAASIAVLIAFVFSNSRATRFALSSIAIVFLAIRSATSSGIGVFAATGLAAARFPYFRTARERNCPGSSFFIPDLNSNSISSCLGIFCLQSVPAARRTVSACDDRLAFTPQTVRQGTMTVNKEHGNRRQTASKQDSSSLRLSGLKVVPISDPPAPRREWNCQRDVRLPAGSETKVCAEAFREATCPSD